MEDGRKERESKREREREIQALVPGWQFNHSNIKERC
jgi:hypothetical protein